MELVPFLLVKFGPEKLRKRETLIKINFEKRGSNKLLMQKLKKEQVIITHTQIKDVKEELTNLLELKVLVNKTRSIEDVYYFIQSIDHVNSIEIIVDVWLLDAYHYLKIDPLFWQERSLSLTNLVALQKETLL